MEKAEAIAFLKVVSEHMTRQTELLTEIRDLLTDDDDDDDDDELDDEDEDFMDAFIEHAAGFLKGHRRRA